VKKLRSLVLLALAPLLPACAGSTVCDTSALASVSVTVLDEAGQRVQDARVTFTRDGGAEEQAECVPSASGAGCAQWVAGWERPGDFVVKATSADGTRQAQGQATVGDGTCHVEGQSLQLTLR
jgi:hypothetical protein